MKLRRPRKLKMTPLRKAGMIVIVILLALVIFFTVFHTETVIVSGNTRYSDEDIKAMCLDGALSNNTFLFTLIHGTIRLSDMPYLDHVDSEMIDRNTIHLSVDERISAGRIEFGGKMIYFDKKGNVLEIREPGDDQDLTAVLVEGVRPEAETIETGDVIFGENEELLTEVSILSVLLLQYDLTPDKVMIGEDNSMTLIFGNLEFNLGSDAFLEEKMARAAAIYADVKGSTGILHLEDYSESQKDIIFEEKQTEDGTVSDLSPA